MKRLEISANAGCKVNCNYCPHQKTVNHLTKSSYKMTFQTFKDCLKTVPKDVEICFAGFSEPFLNDDCIDMIIYADQEQYPILIYTTTVGFDLSKLEKIAHIKFVSFEVHMPTKTGKEKITIDSTYKDLLLSIYTNFKEVNFTFVCNNHGDELIELLPFVPKNLIHIEESHSRAGNNKDFASPIKNGVLKCDRDLMSNVLLPNGDVAICCQDFGANHIVGNLLDHNYESIFQSKAFVDFKMLMSLENSDILCRKCEYAIIVNE